MKIFANLKKEKNTLPLIIIITNTTTGNFIEGFVIRDKPIFTLITIFSYEVCYLVKNLRIHILHNFSIRLKDDESQ